MGKIFTITYNQTPIKDHIKYHPRNSVNINYTLNFMSIYHLKFSANKEWVLWTHLITYSLLVTKLVFPTGYAYVVIAQATSFSESLEECKSQYQGRQPENCENTKFYDTLLLSGTS